MRIAYVIINANRREGTSRAVLEVAERLAKRHDVDLWARTAEDFNRTRLTLRQVGGRAWPAVWGLSSFASHCDRDIAKEDYDIIHCAGVNTRFADVYTVQTIQIEKRRAMQKVAANQGASWPRRLTRYLYDQRVIQGERKCYTLFGPKGVRAFAPVAEVTKAELFRHYPVADAEIEVIPNGADIDRFNPVNRESARPETLRRHGLAEEDFLLLFSGGEWRRKGLDYAIRSLSFIDDPRIKLLVAGSDPVSHELEALPGKLGVADRVVFAGFRSDIEKYYAASDLFLFPTSYEAFSLATIEAAASGLPVLMPDVSGAAELIGSGEAGAFIEREPKAIAQVVQRLLSDTTELGRLKKGARRLVERHYTWDHIAEKTEKLYERLLERRRK